MLFAVKGSGSADTLGPRFRFVSSGWPATDMERRLSRIVV